MADNRGFVALINAVERFRESVNSFGDRQLDLTRVIREELRSQTGYLDRILKSFQKGLNDKLSSPSPSRLEIKNVTIEALTVKISAKSVVSEGAKEPKKEDSLTAKELAKEIAKIKIETKSNPIGQIVSGALFGASSSVGGNFSRGVQSAVKERKGISAEGFGVKTGNFLADPSAIKRAVETSKEVSKGLLQGIDFPQIKASGIELASALIAGAKERLEIKSPSKVFYEIGLDVVGGFADGLDGLGDGTANENISNFVRDTDKKVAGFIDTLREKVGNFFNSLGEKFPILGKLKDLIIGIGAGILLSKGLEMFVGWVTQLADASFDAVLQLETMERTLSALTGSSREGAKGLAFVRAEAQRLGLELKGAEEAYAGFKATTQYTSIRGAQADRIFSTFSQTAALRGLSNDEQGRFFQAINQSLSKGKLSAEEVTGQLGEISALNFKQTLARAIGTDGAQLEKLMQQGIATADILPKIAAQYEAENAAIAGSSDTTAQALTRYNNSLLLLQRSFKDWVSGSKIFFNAAAGGIEALTVAIPPLITIVGNLIVTMGLEQSGGLLTSILKSATGMAALRGGVAALLTTLQSALPVIGAFLAKFLLVSLAIESVSNAFSLIGNAFPEMQRDIEQTTIRANQLKAALEAVGNAAPGATKPLLPTNRNDVTTDKTLNLFGMQTQLNLEPVRKFLGLATRGNKELSDFQANVGDTVQQVDRTLSEEFSVKKTLVDVKELDKQLTVIRSRRFNIAAGDKTAYNASLDQEAKVLEQRDKLLKATSSFQQNLEADSATIKEQIKLLDELVARKGVTQTAEASIRATLNQRLADIDKTKSAFDDLVSSLAKSVNALELALRSLNEQAAYFNETLDRTTAQQKARVITEGLANGQGSQTTDFQLQAIDQSALGSRLDFLQKQFQAVNGLLARPDFESIATELKSQAQQLGLNLENTATLDRLIGESRSTQETQVLEAIKQQLLLKTQIATTQEQVAQGSQGLQTGFLDLSKAVQDYFFNLQQQIKEAQNEIEKIISQLRYGRLKSMLQRALVPGADTFVNGLINQIQGIFDQAASITEQILGQQGARIAFGGEKRGLEAELQNFTRTLGGATEALIRFTQGLLGGQSSGTSGGTANTGNLQDRERIVADALKQKGITNPYAVAAILGTFKQESGFNPAIRERDAKGNLVPGGGLGLAQWSFERTARVPKLTGSLATDINNQIELFLDEITPGGKYDDTISLSKGVKARLQNARSLEDAMGAMQNYERFGIAGPRMTYAQQYLKKVQAPQVANQSNPNRLPVPSAPPVRNPGQLPSPPPVDNSQAQALTQSLINAKEQQLNLGDSAVKQQVSDFILNLTQTRETINRQLADNIRQTQQSVLDAQNQFTDIKGQYSPQTQSSQITQELRGVDTQFKTFDTQLSDQQRNFQDNIKGLDNLLGQVNPIINLLKQSGSEVDQQSAQFLQGLVGGIEADKKTYQGYLNQITKIREQLKSGKLEAQEFVKAQAELRTLQSDLERIGQELTLAQGQQNLEREKQISLLQAQRQLELDILNIRNNFADNPQEATTRINLLREQFSLKQKEIENTYTQKKLEQEINIISKQLSIAQSGTNLDKQRELELLQSQKQLEQEILQIKAQGTDLAYQEQQIELARQQAKARDRATNQSYDQQGLDRRQTQLDYQTNIREGEAKKFDRFGLSFKADELRQRNAIDQEAFRYQQEQSKIKSQYWDNPDMANNLLAQADALNKLNIQDIDQQYRDFGETLIDLGANGVTSFFDDWISGSKSAGEAFADFGKLILSTIAKMIIQFLVLKAVQTLTGFFGGGGGGGGFSNTFSGFPSTPGVVAAATGGLIRGPGTGTSDSIPALLSNGEFVINAAAVKNYGAHLLDNLNQGNVTNFDLGSLRVSSGSSNAGNRSVTVNQTIVTPNADSFNKSEFQQAKATAEMARRAMARL